MATIKQFEDIECWQLARKLFSDIYQITTLGEFKKDFSLKDQVRRSAGSVMDNIAEGFGRDGTKEFIQFLSYAKGSASEVQSQLYRALDCNYINTETFNDIYNRTNNIIGKLTNLIKYLTSSNIKGNKYPK
ncbi:four helix bundle protein [Alkalitalea saponilacus]|uniref:Four helix bundle protein n=1 Tax=Alkalitalea saponilacus TaxID=889453 RepID=A0A1T5GFT5_9BACT|nr:four helix bundle protein [Alkalitalea saponilacus]ASB47957.1 four helix bundle protein [Alkalitalea saponilacus]SKC07230.1 four helix bundle protein [Alkalitalea saponilacus]